MDIFAHHLPSSETQFRYLCAYDIGSSDVSIKHEHQTWIYGMWEYPIYMKSKLRRTILINTFFHQLINTHEIHFFLIAPSLHSYLDPSLDEHKLNSINRSYDWYWSSIRYEYLLYLPIIVHINRLYNLISL